jgi:hypothetical protein
MISAMLNAYRNPTDVEPIDPSGRGLQRLQFELALDLSFSGEQPPVEMLRRAASTADADILLVLPAPSGEGMTAVVRLREDGNDVFLQVGSAGTGFVIAEEAVMDAALLELARASADVLQRISADSAIREPLAV